MLVLSRNINESIIITNEQTGEQIEFKLLSCRNGKGRIGITASDNYRIDREEILEQNTLAEMPTGG